MVFLDCTPRAFKLSVAFYALKPYHHTLIYKQSNMIFDIFDTIPDSGIKLATCNDICGKIQGIFLLV